jgi:RNA polymerase sigma-70 factor (ECF subfamily)
MDAIAFSRAGVDRLGFEDFYAAEYERVFSSAYAFCRDREQALDATQEAFARAFARWRRLDQEEWAGAWVTTTALNVLRRGFRRDRRTALPTEEVQPPGSADLIDALRTLPGRQRQAATLFYVADLPVVVVARSMGVSEGTVKSHLSRARDALRKRLGEEDG